MGVGERGVTSVWRRCDAVRGARCARSTMRGTKCAAWWLSMLCVSVVCVGANAVVAAQDGTRRGSVEPRVPVPLVAASSDTHAWWVAPAIGTAGELRLYLHTTAMSTDQHRALLPLATAPQAMAAWENRIWMVYTTTAGDDALRREVYSIDAVRIPVQGIYIADPPDRMRMLPALPGRGVLTGLTATASGPVALLMPDAASRRATHMRADGEADDGEATGDDGAGSAGGSGGDSDRAAVDMPVLLHLTATGWRAIDLPSELDHQRDWHLLATGPANRTLWLLAAHPSLRDHTLVYRRTLNADMAGGQWTEHTHDLPMSRVVELVDVGASGMMPAAVLRDRSSDTMRLVYLRPDRALALATVEGVTMRWAIVGLRDGFRLIELSTQAGLRVRMIDGIDGRVSMPVAMSPQPLGTSRVIHIPLILTLCMTALILWMLMRSSRQPERPPPGRWRPLPIVPRLVALVIDLVPSGVLAILLLDGTPGDLLLLPAWTADLKQAMPAVVMVAIGVAHATVAEMIWGVSLGKVMIGARVIRLDGSVRGDKPRVHQTLVRNLFKALTLFAPPLAIFALLSPLLQGLGDQFTTTLVAYKAPIEVKPSASGAPSPPDRDP